MSSRQPGARTPSCQLPASDAAAYLKDKLYALAPIYQAVATLYAPACRIAGRRGFPADELEPIDETTCLLTSRPDTLERLAPRLAMLGCDFELHHVLGPEPTACAVRCCERYAARTA